MFRPALFGCLLFAACTKGPAPNPLAKPFSDDFNRSDLGPSWKKIGGHWTIREGQVYSTGANNAPLFLNVDLPDDLVVEIEAQSETELVDTKLELMTDGMTHASGYIFILGGWSNALSVIARKDEHGDDRKTKGPTGVTGKRWYRWRIEKRGGELRWYLDGRQYMTFSDAEPLSGSGQNRLALSNWQNQIRYDNLSIWPYDQAPPPRTEEPPTGMPLTNTATASP